MNFKNVLLIILIPIILGGMGCGENCPQMGGDTETHNDTQTESSTETDVSSDSTGIVDGGDTDIDTESEQTGADCNGCWIGDHCWPNGAINPNNICVKCDIHAPEQGKQWSNNDGQICDDGFYCTGVDTCQGGQCQGAPRICSDGIYCNGEETCDFSQDICVPGTSNCLENEICDYLTDQCISDCFGCEIDGVCYGHGQKNPDNQCQECNMLFATDTWFLVIDGTPCDDGLFCNGTDQCSKGECAEHLTPPCEEDGFFCNGEMTCDESMDRCVEGAVPCQSDELCLEEQLRCCVPNIISTDLSCSLAGDVVGFDSCGTEIIVDDCVSPADNGECIDYECTCKNGYMDDPESPESDCDLNVIPIDAGPGVT